MEQMKKGIYETAKKIEEKEEIPRRNVWFDKECQII
jgi:hypothetical protein